MSVYSPSRPNSLVMVILPVLPRRSAIIRSSLRSSSSVKTVPPVRMARPPRMLLWLSPKPGTFTAAT
jgi:hypothetical protein